MKLEKNVQNKHKKSPATEKKKQERYTNTSRDAGLEHTDSIRNRDFML